MAPDQKSARPDLWETLTDRHGTRNLEGAKDKVAQRMQAALPRAETLWALARAGDLGGLGTRAEACDGPGSPHSALMNARRDTASFHYGKAGRD